MRRFTPILCVSLFLCLFFTSSKAFGSLADDLDYVSFEGVVTDANGGAIANTRVIAHHTATGNERAAKTDAQGRYRLAKLPPGVYTLRAEASGFQTLTYENLETVAGTNVKRDFKLNPATVEAQVTIDAQTDPVLIDTTRTVVGGTVTRQQIEQLPTESRNPLDLIYTLPGTAAPAYDDRTLAEGDNRNNFARTPEEAGIFSLTGGTAFSNNITIEGLDNNDDRAARERFLPSTHAVEEVQVITNQFSAEYGRASGGRVNLRLRSGANRYSGQAFYYFRDESLNANGFARNRDVTRGFRIPFQNHNPGVSLGGPIKKDKLFFFTAYEYEFIYDRAEIAALVPIETNPAFPLPRPTGANLGSTGRDSQGRVIIVNGGAAVGFYDETVTTPRVAHTWQTRSDWKLSGNHNAFMVYTLARNRDERSFSGGRRTLDTLRRTGRNSQSIAIGDDLVLSPQAVNNLRFQFSRLTPADAPPNANPVVIIDIDDPRDVRGDADDNALTRTGPLTAGASTLNGVSRREDRYQVQETLHYVRGRHTLRFGGDVQLIRARFVELRDTTGTFTFASVADFLANRPAQYEQRLNTASEQHNTYTGIFVQDDWRARPNLTFSFGLRWDNEKILRDRNNFGPRASFAWDPFKSAKTTVRGGYGIFYSRALLRTLDDYVVTSNKLLVDTDNEAARPLLAALRFPQPLAANDPRVTQAGVPIAGFLRRLGDDFRIPESYQASLGVEREIARGFKIEINYVFNRGLHLWREINANAARLPAGFDNFAAYLTSRSFDNRLDPSTGQRPITNTGNADLVRFELCLPPDCLPTEISRINTEGGRTIIFNLDHPATSRAAGHLVSALRAIRNLRPDPGLTQVEELQARGNSYYHGVSVEAQRRFAKRGAMRASYTLSKLIDDGVLNDSSPLRVGDFRGERALSLLDARHRVAVSGHYELPPLLGRVTLAGTLNLSSARPFSIGANGQDRNLDDIDNDRPNFSGDLDAIEWRRPGTTLNQALANAFSLPTIGTTGNLPRNAGRGPGVYTLNLRAARSFRLAERRKLELQVEAFNPFNAAVFSFGAEFVNYAPTGLGNFLVPSRVVKPRTMRLGLKLEF